MIRLTQAQFLAPFSCSLLSRKRLTTSTHGLHMTPERNASKHARKVDSYGALEVNLELEDLVRQMQHPMASRNKGLAIVCQPLEPAHVITELCSTSVYT